MKILFLFLLILFMSCAHREPGGSPSVGKTNYSFTDVSGSYRLVREFKNIKQKIVTRNQILNTSGGNGKVLEKSIAVSRLGSIKSKDKRILTLRPEASEFTVWLEGKRYTSKMQLNPKTKSMRVTLDSPETRWQGSSEIPFPKGRYFCFYNQIPECLYHNYFLTRSFEDPKKKFDFYILWDSYPFIQDQLTHIGKNLFSAASVKFDGEIKKTFRYIVEVEGQIIIYQFSKSFDLVKISWIAQGISVTPPGEEVVSDEE